MGDSEITTPQDSYEYYEGVKNKIPLIITDPSGEKGTINITVKDQDEYKQLSTYYNIGEGYELSTESLVTALQNLYDTPSDSYTINVTYSSEYANPSSTEFTLNIIRQRNTTITYDILNNTEGNVQINITVLDQVYNSPVNDATISITGDITESTTAGVITDNTLTAGDHTIKVQYPENHDYKASEATIDFHVEVDKDKKIRELEEEISNLTIKLEEEISNLTIKLEDAQHEITALNNTNKGLTRELKEAKEVITALNNTKNNLTRELEEQKINLMKHYGS